MTSRTIEIKVPDIGDFHDVPVIEVLVSPGDKVGAEDSLITLESDKATMEVPSPQAGVIREVRLKVNDQVSEGDVVAVLEVADHSDTGKSDEDSEPGHGGGEAAGKGSGGEATARQDTGGDASAQGGGDGEAQSREREASEFAVPDGDGDHVREPPAPEPVKQLPDQAGHTPGAAGPPPPPAGTAAAVDPAQVPYASPSVRKFARELGADLKRVKGSGNGGRILKEDVTGYVKSVMTSRKEAAGGPAGFSLPAMPDVDFARFGEISVQPLSRIRKLSAGFLHRNWVGIPHVTQHDEADITDMEAFRTEHAPEAKNQGFKLTPLVFLIKASVMALREFPQFNASLDPAGENLILKSYFNIGVAVDTSEGLVVPVLRECDRKGLMELARELGEVSARAREQKLRPEDIQGGCFSISSLGGIGGTSFTPIINAPEVAILGVSRSRMQPVWDGKAFRPRLMLPLSLSYDHRVIDGAAAARFARYLASQLEDLRRLTL